MRQELIDMRIPPIRELGAAIVARRKTAPRPIPSARHGMGAIPHANGTSFRVWAPNAQAVFVAGSFNHWSPTSQPLAREADGRWSADVRSAKAGSHYKYRIVTPLGDLWRIDPYARAVTHSAGEGIVYAGPTDVVPLATPLPPREDLVIYEMHIGTFYTPRGKLPATFDDARHQLPYLKKLGINVIEVMPPMAFPGPLSWGYNPAHLFAIDSDYGGPDAFKRFINDAHKLGLGVILDVVYNHFGPDDLDLWQFDGWSQNGLGGIYFYNDARAVTPWGHTRPDYGRPEVRQFIRDNIRLWIEEYRLDGLRLDATSYIRYASGFDDGSDLPDGWRLLREIHEDLAVIAPGTITIAEDLRRNPWITKSIGAGGAGFSAQWDDVFVHPVRAALIVAEDEQRDLHALAQALTYQFDGDPFARVIYTESHDEVANGKARVPEEIWPSHANSVYAKKRSLLGAVLVLTTPGIPMIFQGQEFLMDAWFTDSHAIDWGKRAMYSGIQALYHDLIHLRHGGDGRTRGLLSGQIAITHINHDAKVLAFRRWSHGGAGDDVMVILNLRNTTYEEYALGMPAAGRWRVRLASDSATYDKDFTQYPARSITAKAEPLHDLPAQAKILLRPYSALIVSQDPV